MKNRMLTLLVLSLLLVLPHSGALAQAAPQAPAQPGFQGSPQAPAQGSSQGPEEQSPIKVTTGLVHLVVTVTDKRHSFITDLDQSDFTVLENGAPQKIEFFDRETDLPLRIGLLLDTSNSIRSRLAFEKDAAVNFLGKVIRRNKDLAFLMTFDNEPEVIQDYTEDLDALSSAIRAQRAGGGTALNDAIFKASDKLIHAPQPKGLNSDVRHVIVVISDGDDNLSDRALSEAIDASIRAEAGIYTISTNTAWLSTGSGSMPQKYNLDENDKVLKQFADQTGGQSFFPYRVDDLNQSFLDIDTELRRQYFIGYSPAIPATNGQYRKIEVQTDRKGLIVRTRKGYYPATPAASQPPKPAK